MEKFWELLANSTVVQAGVTFVLVVGVTFMYATGRAVPAELLQITMVVIGYWFGTKAQHTIEQTARVAKR